MIQAGLPGNSQVILSRLNFIQQSLDMDNYAPVMNPQNIQGSMDEYFQEACIDKNPLKYEKLLSFLQNSLRRIETTSRCSQMDKKYKDEIVAVLKKQKENPQMKQDSFKEIRNKIREIVAEYENSG